MTEEVLTEDGRTVLWEGRQNITRYLKLLDKI